MWSVVTGEGGGEVGPGSPAPCFPFAPVPGEALGSPRPPSLPTKPSSVSLRLLGAWPRGPGHTSGLGYSCGFQLLEAAVVASSKHGCGSAVYGTEGLFIAGWPWGLEPGLGPGEVHRLLIRDRRDGDR